MVNGSLLALALAAASQAAGAHPPEAVPPVFTLEEALQELDAQNLTLAQARRRADEADAAVGQVRAQLVPTLSLAGSYVRNSDDAVVSPGNLLQQLTPPGEPTPPAPADLVIQPLEVFNGSATLRVPLVAPAAWFDVAAARHSSRAAGASADAVRQSLRAGLAQAGWGALAAEERVGASERAVEAASEHARTARRKLEAGTAEALSVTRAETELVKRESELAQARAERDRARLALGILLGRAEPVRIAMPSPRPAEPVAVEAVEALRVRPEMAARTADVRAAEQRLASARWRLAPQISATGTAFASNQPFATGEEEGWRATIDLTWTPFDGGLRSGRRREAEAKLAGARAGEAEQRLHVIQEVEDASRDVRVALERLRLAERQRALAGDSAESAGRGYEAGVAGALDVVDANDRLYQAELGLAEAHARLGIAVVALDRAAGRGP